MKDTNMKLYHGSNRKIENIESTRAMYFSLDVDVAKEYALGLDDCGNYNKESWIYSIEINKKDSTLIDDFTEFDPIGDLDYNEMPAICHNDESEYFCVKSVGKLDFIEMFQNQL